jgi:hypothetical protein
MELRYKRVLCGTPHTLHPVTVFYFRKQFQSMKMLEGKACFFYPNCIAVSSTFLS